MTDMYETAIAKATLIAQAQQRLGPEAERLFLNYLDAFSLRMAEEIQRRLREMEGRRN